MVQAYHFSAPGRTEISGNHTDHQHGCVLAAAVNLETVAEVTLNDRGVAAVASEGYAPVEIDLSDLSIHPEEKNTTAALIRGVAAAFAQRGAKLQGFDAKVRSTVLPGSGLSSSAAFEVLIGTIFNELFFEKRLTAVEVAQIGQYAENVYFGKPSGLMDQTASSVGGMVFIDFADPAHPVVENLSLDLNALGYALCIVDSGADHADLTDEYAAIPVECRQVAAFFGKEVLRDVDEAAFYAQLKEVRAATSDRAILRAIHFFGENKRVQQQFAALQAGDFDAFLQMVTESGRSSWMYLQDITPAGAIQHQDMAVALALCDRLLQGSGAFRVHGGGFAGTVQAFVPLAKLEQFRSGIEAVLGQGACHVLSIRAEGGVRLD
ncbi:MAG TPA: galactokinase [Candidatus Avoscillospira avicola]|uniref:Galactokinase n=1 Tax=Candidatus Avoscillospira avicola TaxID=2840706 RepID=A0A9D1DIC6_9FIRM|nr:galactokinase [Candidatus Avoscillospira avicola]